MKNRKIAINAYKYNGWLYRSWEFPKLIEETEDYICFAIQGVKVITSDKKSDRFFHSKIAYEGYWIFLKKEWFNIIIGKKKNKITYYINIASPFLIEEETLKYIDFDLDYQMNDISLKHFKELDMKEYRENLVKYQYSDKLNQFILNASEIVKDSLKQNKLQSKYGKDFFYRIRNKK